jgi:tensin
MRKMCVMYYSNPDILTSMIYDRCGLQRVGVVVAAYCEYTGLCPPNQQDQQSLDRFSMKRFLNERVGGLRTPSDKR